MVTRIKIGVMVVPLKVFCLVYFFKLCESNSFFQISNDPTLALRVSNNNVRLNPFHQLQNVPNQPSDQRVSKNKHWHNIGQVNLNDTNNRFHDGPRKLGLGKKFRTRKGRENRTGHKKPRKHPKIQTNPLQPLSIIKNSDPQTTLHLQDLSLVKPDKTEFFFPVLSSPGKKVPLVSAASNFPVSNNLKSISQSNPLNQPPSSSGSNNSAISRHAQSQPQKSTDTVIRNDHSSINPPVKLPAEVYPTKKSPSAVPPDIPQSWVRKDVKMANVPEDALISILQEKQSNGKLNRAVDSPFLNNKPQNDPDGPVLDFPKNVMPNDGGGVSGEQEEHHQRQTQTEEKGSSIDNQAEYNERCQVSLNLERKRQCSKMEAGKDEDDQQQSRKIVSKPLDLDNLIESAVVDDTMTRSMPNKLRARHLHNVDQQNRKLAIAALKQAIFHMNDTTQQEPRNGFRLLDTTKKIFGKICPPHVIPTMFLEMVVSGFKILHQIISPHRSPFIEDKEWEWIDSVLQNCYATSQPPAYIQSPCQEDIWAVNSSTNPICLGSTISTGIRKSTVCFQTNIDVFDPILDVVWLMFEGVKANCFNYFQGSARLLHRYSVGIMDLFTRPMKYRWALQNKEKIFWERILGPGLDLYLDNLDKCVHHITEESPLNFRTQRFLNTHTVRLSHSFTDVIVP